MAKMNEARNGLASSGWTQLSTNVFERPGYTALVRVDGVLIIKCTGARRERKF